MSPPAAALLARPLVTHQPVGSLLHIIRRRAHGIVQVGLVHAAGVIPTEGLVVVPILGMQLLQPISILGALGAIADHLQDTSLGIGRVEGDAVVRLHDARVADAVVGGGDADVAAGFLNDDAEDAADVDAALARDLLDGLVDVVDLGVAVVELHERAVHAPERGVRGPLARVRVGRGGAGVVDVSAAAVGAAGGADDLAVGLGRVVVGARVVGAAAGEVDDLADLQGGWVDARVGGFEGTDGGAVVFGNLPEGVALFDGVRHFVWCWLMWCWFGCCCCEVDLFRHVVVCVVGDLYRCVVLSDSGVQCALI